ncbi:MAG: carboxypeptidase regulatory-like domain-containing protein [Pseudoxanthomonas sp.]
MKSHKGSKKLRRTALGVALGMCFAGAAMAQQMGGLRITINDTAGQPVAGATVKASSPDSLVSKTGVTGADGQVRLIGLDPATNYTIEVAAQGYNDFSAGNVAVVSGQNLSLGYVLGGGEGATNLDTIVVTGAGLAAIDTTSATVSTILNLDLTESLPTARSYQSYLQLVPGVKPSASGNPSSKSGVNYSDNGGDFGDSTDNLYYVDGVDVTDPLTGTFGSNLNSEIIQEMQVLTGGIPAEFAGGQGLISGVITKSGSNEWHGSVNYYAQNDSLVQKNKHLDDTSFSTYDTAVTLGGPIVKDKLWFFASYQKVNREEDVTDPVTQQAMRSVTRESERSFGKLTWQATDNDRLVATFFNDPQDQDGSLDPTVVNTRSTIRKQGGDNYKLEYSHDWDNLSLGAYAYKHEAELSSFASTSDPFNDVAHHSDRTTATNADLGLGGTGQNVITARDSKEFGLKLDYLLSTSWGDHTFKTGFLRREGSYMEQTVYMDTGTAGARYSSISADDAGTTLAQYFSNSYGWAGARAISSSDMARLRAATGMTNEQLLATTFNDTTGNPDGQVNVYRIFQSANDGLGYTVKSKKTSFYLQDSWTLDQFSANIGVRAERDELVNSLGASIHKFDWNFAPRLSVAYDVNGDGRSKVWAYYGRYYDALRADMADFAGAVTGPTYDEQININGEWVTFRQRGPGDAAVAPNIKTPYTDEFLVGYATNLGQDYSLSMTLTKRVTKDIMEDYDLSLYSNPEGNGDDSQAPPGSYFYLPLSYFGYKEDPGTNYVLGTLKGGKREYQGLEVTLQKVKSNNWQGLASFTLNDAHGNSNSDGNADFQGDWLALDPRAPNQWGPQPGNIEKQFKALGTYFWDSGLELSGVFNWNSGLRYSRTYLAYGRHLPVMDDPYEYEDVTDTWISKGAVGSQVAPSYYTFDVRAKYTKALPFGKLEFFLDIFNVFDNQATTLQQDLVDGDGVYGFGQAIEWVEPRRAYLGVRYSF